MTAEALKPGVVLVARYRIDEVDAAEPAFRATDLRTNSCVELFSVDDREADALETVVGFHGPDLLELLEVVRVGGMQLAACEVADGATLSDMVSERGARDPEEGVRLLLSVASTLAHLHRSNAIHGSVTPQTILVGKRSRLAFRPGRRGTSAFRCPERNAGGGPSARDDAWALAACLYYALVGEPPARSGIGAPDELYLAGIDDQTLRSILFQGLATARVQRVASAEPLRAALEQWLGSNGSDAGKGANPFGGKLTEVPRASVRRAGRSSADLVVASTERDPALVPSAAPAGTSAASASPAAHPSVRNQELARPPLPPPGAPPSASPSRRPPALPEATLESPAFTPETPPSRRRESARPPQLTAPGIAARPPLPPLPPPPPPPPRSATLESPAAPVGASRPRFGFGSTATLESPRMPPRADTSARNQLAPPRPPERKFGGTMVMPDATPAASSGSARPRYDQVLDDDQTAVMDSALLGSTLLLDGAGDAPAAQAALPSPSGASPTPGALAPPAPEPPRAPPPAAAPPPTPPVAPASASAADPLGVTMPLAATPMQSTSAASASAASASAAAPVGLAGGPAPGCAATSPVSPALPSVGAIASAPAAASAGPGIGRWLVMAGGLGALAIALLAAWFVFVRKPSADGSASVAMAQPTPALSVSGAAQAAPPVQPQPAEPQPAAPQPAVAEAKPAEPQQAAPVAGEDAKPADSAAPATARGDVNACVMRWMPEGTFRKAPNTGWLCEQTDARKGALDFKKQVILGAGGKLTPAMRIVSRLGWYELAAYTTIRDACCQAPSEIFLPEAAPACQSMPKLMSTLSSAVRSKSGVDAALDGFAKNALCEAAAGRAGAYWMRRAPGGGERAAFKQWLEALRH